jgi:hypothetical protein
MKKFALVGGGTVINIVVAENESSIGPAALALTAIDITNMDPAPSVGSTYDRLTKKFSIAVAEGQKALLTNDTLVLEAPAAPTAKSSTKPSKKAAASEETPAEE